MCSVRCLRAVRGAGNTAARSATGELGSLGLSSATRALARQIAFEASGEAGHLVHCRETLRPLLSWTVSWTWAGREDEYPDSRLRSQEPARQPDAGRRLEPPMVDFAPSGASALWVNSDGPGG